MEVFVAARATTIPPTTSYLFESGANNNALVQSTNNILTYDGAYGPTSSITANTDFIADAFYNGPSSQLSINGGPPQTGNAQANVSSGGITIGNYLGGGHAWGGNIYEVVVFNRSLSTAERAVVNQYMSARYAIPLHTFAPTDLPGCAIWLRSDMGVTAPNGTVSTWLDQSGNNNNVTQSVASNQPGYQPNGGANNQAYTSWTSLSGQALNGAATTLNQPMEVFVAARATTIPPTTSYLFESGANNNALVQSTNNILTYDGAYGPTSSITANTDFIADAFYNGPSSQLSINGGPSQTGNAQANVSSGGITIGNYLGGGHAWGGNIYEVVVFNRSLSTAERAVVNQYMSARYAIPLHTFAPTDLPGCAIWLRSDMGVTAPNGTVSTWLDQSGNNNNVTQSVASNQPGYQPNGGANNQAYTSWTSLSGQALNAPATTLNQPMEVFVVGSATTSNPSTTSYLFETGANNSDLVQNTSSNNLVMYDGAYGPTLGIAANTDFIADAFYGGPSSQLSINGGAPQTGNPGANVSAGGITIGNYLGGGHAWGGNIYEVVGFNRSLSTAERAVVNQYMSVRYGIPLQTFAPTNLPGCAMWLRSDMGVTAPNGKVSTWLDQSGNNNHVTQSGLSNQPGYQPNGGANNQAYTSWTSLGAQALSSPATTLNQPMEVFVAARATTSNPSTTSYLFETGANNNDLVQNTSSNNLVMYDGPAPWRCPPRWLPRWRASAGRRSTSMTGISPGWSSWIWPFLPLSAAWRWATSPTESTKSRSRC